MSQSKKRPFVEAFKVAEQFRAMMTPWVTCEHFEFAGSLRRKCPMVSDIDVVVVPKFVDIPRLRGLFEEIQPHVNSFWERVENFLAIGQIKKYMTPLANGGERPKWGNVCRAIEFAGWVFDVTMADADNFGGWMAVKTGPDPLPRLLVTKLPENGYVCSGSFHLTYRGQPVRNVTEEDFFRYAGMPYKPPELR